RRRRGGDHRLPLEIPNGPDGVADDEAVVPVVLCLRQVHEALVALGAVVVGLVVQPAEKIVRAVEEPRRTVRVLEIRLIRGTELGRVDLKLEAVLACHTRLAPRVEEGEVGEVARQNFDNGLYGHEAAPLSFDRRAARRLMTALPAPV